MRLHVAEAALLSLPVALGPQGLDERHEIGGVGWGNLDGRRHMSKAAQPDRAGWAIPENLEKPRAPYQ
jgi:hypothetical protein